MPKEAKGFLEEVVQLVNDGVGLILDAETVPEVNTDEAQQQEPEAKQRTKRGTFIAAPKAPKVIAGKGDDGDGDGDGDATDTGTGGAPKA